MSGLSLLTIHGDLQEVALPPHLKGGVDVMVTSPPYKPEDGYSDALMVRLGALANEALCVGGRFFLNFGQLRDDFDRPLRAQRLIAGAGKDLRVGQTIVWAKSIAIDGAQRGHYQPLNSEKYLNYCWEYIFTYFKLEETPIDRLSLGVPYADKSNLKRGTRGKNGDLHCGGDLWFVPYKTTGKTRKKKHRHEFPEPLVERCLKVAGLKPGATVLEPFCGGGTTAAVSKRLGFNCITIDIEEDNLRDARERWEKTENSTALS